MSQFKGGCRYNSKWDTHEQYKDWLKPVKLDSRKASCTVCDKIIDLSNMGEGAIKSHMKGGKHVRNIAKLKESTSSVKLESFFKPSESTKLCIPPPTQMSEDVKLPMAKQSTSGLMDAFVCKDDVTKAEIFWTLKLITSHQSYKSSADSDKLFQNMFPDSSIAKNFSCGERKAAYIAVYGIADYFAISLKKNVKGPFVVMFDESLNKKLQEKQMDLVLRFWSDELHRVETRYFTSQFLGK